MPPLGARPKLEFGIVRRSVMSEMYAAHQKHIEHQHCGGSLRTSAVWIHDPWPPRDIV